MANNSDSFKVLSWNICWGCMTEDINDKTAAPLPTKCKTVGNNSCKNNVIKSLKFLNSSKDKFDFIGLQEASGWEDIFNKIKGFFYKYVQCSQGNAEVVTFYNEIQINRNNK